MRRIFDNKEDGDLIGHFQERGKRDVGLEAEVLGHWVKEPGWRTAKVQDLVQHERHYASGENIILHVGVPGRPQSLEETKVEVYVSTGEEGREDVRFLGDQDGQLDRLQLSKQETSLHTSPELYSVSDGIQGTREDYDIGDSDLGIEQILKLQAAIKTLSTVSSGRVILPTEALTGILEGAQLLNHNSTKGGGNPGPNHRTSAPEQDLQWLLISKATTQAYGLVLNLLLDQTIPLSIDIGYWNEVLGSPKYTGLYTIQTSPIRLWHWTRDIYHDAKERLQKLRSSSEDNMDAQATSISDRWRQFYGMVGESVRQRSLADVQSKFMTPFTKCQMEAKLKLKHLRRLREMSATGLGVLMDEGMMFDAHDEDSVSSKAASGDENDEWKTVVSKSVTLMESILRNITTLEMRPGEFEETVFMNVDDEAAGSQEAAVEAASTPIGLALRLQGILDQYLPAHIKASKQLVSEYGRPSRLVRYWLPGVTLLISSSTLLRIFVSRKAEIIQWIRNLGTTTVDFWNNWVLEPAKKVIGTIRHDKDSEIAIMSKESLRGDRASLERMVVDFAIDNSSGATLTEAEIADVRAKVKEGDLTPVLKAYEKDLRRPFVGTLRGDLIRALLIQIQKTKVDVEVAIGGIDNLLKSQELVFGFVGLTPGILVVLGLSRWLSEILAGRKGQVSRDRQGSMIRPLRNIDRILSAATPSNQGMLSYKEHGLLLCEVHVLRQRVEKVLPVEIRNEFIEEVSELVDLRTGIERQIRVVERIRWAFAKWLQ
ncbi:MAG: hypothetical protein Q9163_000441 [Psora crenata]